jgi:nucleotide-binding universal stress UspA family protein
MECTLALATTKIKVNEILFATDFSPASEAAFKAAVSAAKIFGANLNIVNVVPVGYAVGPHEMVMDTGLMARKLAEERIEELKRSSMLNSVRHREYLRDGDVRSTIHELIDQLRIDLVVVGTHGAHGLERVILGSIAEEIFRSVRCPVLTVGPNVADTSLDLKSLLLATDFRLASLRAAQYALSIAQENQAKLTLLTVVSHLDDDSPETLGNAYDHAMQNLQTLIAPDAALWCQPRLQVEFGEPAEAILRVAQENDSHLIILGVRGAQPLASHALWATASKVVQRAKCPVLTVRDRIS